MVLATCTGAGASSLYFSLFVSLSLPPTRRDKTGSANSRSGGDGGVEVNSTLRKRELSTQVLMGPDLGTIP